jgi:chromosome segregation ATPase
LHNKGPLPKGGKYLFCEAAKRGLACETAGWRYDHFETSFLTFVEQLDLPRLIRNESSKKKELDDNIQALQGEILSLQSEMEKAYQLLHFNSSLKFVAEKLSALQNRESELTAELKLKEIERSVLDRACADWNNADSRQGHQVFKCGRR